MEKRCFLWRSAPPPLLCNGAVNTLVNNRGCFLRGPCRGVILKTAGATVQLRVQLWSVKQRATETEELSIAKIRYQKTSSEDIAEEESLRRAVTE
jgi:hypothetical protein